MKKIIFFFGVISSLWGNPPLSVGTTSGYAPYVSLDVKGEYEGFDIDFARLLGKKLGREVVFRDFGSMPALLLALKQKKVDVLLWAISITKERLQEMQMIYYQGDNGNSTPFVFRGPIPEGIVTIEDLGKRKQYTIAVEAGSCQESILVGYPGVRKMSINGISDGVLAVRYGKAAAVMTDPSVVSEILQKNPGFSVLWLPLKPEDAYLGNGICIRKEDLGLAEEVQKAVESLFEENAVAPLEKKWGLRP